MWPWCLTVHLSEEVWLICCGWRSYLLSVAICCNIRGATLHKLHYDWEHLSLRTIHEHNHSDRTAYDQLSNQGNRYHIRFNNSNMVVVVKLLQQSVVNSKFLCIFPNSSQRQIHRGWQWIWGWVVNNLQVPLIRCVISQTLGEVQGNTAGTAMRADKCLLNCSVLFYSDTYIWGAWHQAGAQRHQQKE